MLIRSAIVDLPAPSVRADGHLVALVPIPGAITDGIPPAFVMVLGVSATVRYLPATNAGISNYGYFFIAYYRDSNFEFDFGLPGQNTNAYGGRVIMVTGYGTLDNFVRDFRSNYVLGGQDGLANKYPRSPPVLPNVYGPQLNAPLVSPGQAVFVFGYIYDGVTDYGVPFANTFHNETTVVAFSYLDTYNNLRTTFFAAWWQAPDNYPIDTPAELIFETSAIGTWQTYTEVARFYRTAPTLQFQSPYYTSGYTFDVGAYVAIDFYAYNTSSGAAPAIKFTETPSRTLDSVQMDYPQFMTDRGEVNGYREFGSVQSFVGGHCFYHFDTPGFYTLTAIAYGNVSPGDAAPIPTATATFNVNIVGPEAPPITPALRQFQRDDGIGTGAGRVSVRNAATSRQNGRRVSVRNTYL